MEHTGVFDIDDREIKVGDICAPVRGFYSQKKYKHFRAKLVWIPPMLTWEWSDGYVNPFPVQNPQNFRVVENENPSLLRGVSALYPSTKTY